MKAEQTWRAVLGELEMQMSQASFSTWLRDSKLIAFEDNIFVVGVESGFIKDWLDGRMRSTVERTLAGIVGQETSVSFVVWPEPAAPGPSSKLNLPDRAEETSPTQIVSSKRFLSLENFVSGPENLLALAASQTISEQLHPTQSPLFIYGDIGLGKTHLLSGIKHACDTKGLRAHMMTAEGFTNELVSSIKAGEGDLFRDKYRQCDILLIDDIQFFLGKKSSAEELVHTIEQMHTRNRQIVLASNLALKSLSGLGRSLCSRIEAGLVINISKPSTETRKRILRSKASEHSLELTDDVVSYLAENIQTNVRALEGAIHHLSARDRMLGQPVNLASARLAAEQLSGSSASSGSVTSEHIIEVVATEFSVTPSELRSKSRARRLTAPRQLAMLLLQDSAGCSLSQIGALLGGRDHTTARYGCNKARELLSSDIAFRTKADDVLLLINKP
jgi:chromosomal replication initiator protein